MFAAIKDEKGRNSNTVNVKVRTLMQRESQEIEKDLGKCCKLCENVNSENVKQGYTVFM